MFLEISDRFLDACDANRNRTSSWLRIDKLLGVGKQLIHSFLEVLRVAILVTNEIDAFAPSARKLRPEVQRLNYFFQNVI